MANLWQIGPIINGVNSSPGMPSSFTTEFNFPLVTNPNANSPSVHYVTTPFPSQGSLWGNMGILYSIQASEDAVFTAVDGLTPGRIALHFQRPNVDWTQLNTDRWWSKTRPVLTPGDHFFSADLGPVENWIKVSGVPTQTEFNSAKSSIGRVGFTFGGTGNAGHGVCLTRGSAKFIVRYFGVFSDPWPQVFPQ